MTMKIIEQIEAGQVTIGIELGSTRIKAVLIDQRHETIAQGNHDWANQLEGGHWTYSLDAVKEGLRAAYKDLAVNVRRRYGTELREVRAIGISAMMHGYLAFDEEDELLVPFRTWRNVNTDAASKKLTELFRYNIPHRWSIAHLYQAMLNREDHVPQIRFLTTLAGYVHWQLTEKKVLGVGDAAGMFPINDATGDYEPQMLEQFNALDEVRLAGLQAEQILPRVLSAGEPAGTLTQAGALLLDPSGTLQPGCLLCPPEGDAGTGMVATNTITRRTGNVSAGTSIFAMVVLEKALSDYYPEIDMVTTPDGKPVAMVHCNNGTPETDAWVGMFSDLVKELGYHTDKIRIYDVLYNKALEAEPDAGSVISINYLAGEPIAKVQEGRPMYIRRPDSNLNLANFMLSQLYSICVTLKLGMDILVEDEQVRIEELLGHGGVFKTERVMQTVMASVLDVPMAVYRSAGEGGAWGIALLAAFAAEREQGETLDRFLAEQVFTERHARSVIQPDVKLKEGFRLYLENYRRVLELERLASEYF